MQELAHEPKGLAPQQGAHPVSTPLSSVPVLQPADDQDDDPDEIFVNAITQIDTQPLPALPPSPGVCWPLVCLTVLLLVSFAGGTALALLTYPTVIIDVVPVTRSITLTASLALPTRVLAPLTLSRAETIPTTGTGHQDARAATGILTLYNGLFTAQRLPAGTVFSGQDGVEVATEADVTIPAGNPPSYGQATIEAQAVLVGSAGNIAAGDINTSVSSGVLVKNGLFSGGRDARSFQAVAQADIDHLTATLQNSLSQQFPQAFVLRPGEAVQPLNCTFNATPDHRAGEEASTVTVQATETCKGLAYVSKQLNQQAAQAFTTQTSPGAQYQLIGEVHIQLASMTPLTVSCRGLWAYILSPDYEHFLAQQIAGDSPQQAQKYLLQTGFLTRATVPDKLPPDPAHIHFQMLIGL